MTAWFSIPPFVRVEAETVFYLSGAYHDGCQSRLRRLAGALASFCAMTLPMSGCSRAPSRIEAPDWDPPALASRIITELDNNDDAHVDSGEWAAAPGLAAGARFIDTNKDGRLSREEIEARFERYRKLRIGLRPQAFRIVYSGRPVAGAEAVFLPEPFLEDIIEPARGTTDAQGIVTPQTEGQDLPGMRTGYYRVQIASPHVKIPAKYTSAALLGAEASPVVDNPFAAGVTELRLTD